MILLAPEDRPERRQWAAAHELGEQAAHRVFARLGVDPTETPEGAREQSANRFASSLLLPTRWFLPDALDADWDLLLLKEVYATASHELIVRRFLDLHPAPVVVTVVDNGEQTWRRGAPWRPPPPCPAEMDVWRQAHEHGQPAQARSPESGVARVRAWPIHESGWRREIVLTELEE